MKANYALTPDFPIAFGCKSTWLAIYASSGNDVLRFLPLQHSERANWQTGISAAHGQKVFVSPSIDNWMFVVGEALPDFEVHEQKLLALMRSLAHRFPDVQYFATNRTTEYHGWARLVRGSDIRAYAYIGDRGKTLINLGRKTPEEEQLGLNFFDETSSDAKSAEYWKRDDLRFPKEDDVVELAGRWSLNPEHINRSNAEAGVGWVANLKP